MVGLVIMLGSFCILLCLCAAQWATIGLLLVVLVVGGGLCLALVILAVRGGTPENTEYGITE